MFILAEWAHTKLFSIVINESFTLNISCQSEPEMVKYQHSRKVGMHPLSQVEIILLPDYHFCLRTRSTNRDSYSESCTGCTREYETVNKHFGGKISVSERHDMKVSSRLLTGSPSSRRSSSSWSGGGFSEEPPFFLGFTIVESQDRHFFARIHTIVLGRAQKAQTHTITTMYVNFTKFALRGLRIQNALLPSYFNYI